MSNFHISPDGKRRPCTSIERCKYGIQSKLQSMGNDSYYGAKVSHDHIKHLTEIWSKAIGESYAQELLNNRHKRDRTSDYHMTIISPPEKRELDKENKIVQEDQKSFTIVPQGIGRQNDDKGNETWYIIASSPEASKQRKQLGLPEKDFHITLGFTGKDIHNVPKDMSTDAICQIIAKALT